MCVVLCVAACVSVCVAVWMHCRVCCTVWCIVCYSVLQCVLQFFCTCCRNLSASPTSQQSLLGHFSQIRLVFICLLLKKRFTIRLLFECFIYEDFSGLIGLFFRSLLTCFDNIYAYLSYPGSTTVCDATSDDPEVTCVLVHVFADLHLCMYVHNPWCTWVTVYTFVYVYGTIVCDVSSDDPEVTCVCIYVCAEIYICVCICIIQDVRA